MNENTDRGTQLIQMLKIKEISVSDIFFEKFRDSKLTVNIQSKTNDQIFQNSEVILKNQKLQLSDTYLLFKGQKEDDVSVSLILNSSDTTISELSLELKDQRFGIWTKNIEINWDVEDHGEVVVEMTKPIESIQRSGSTKKARKILKPLGSPKNKDKNDFVPYHESFLNMTMTDNYKHYIRNDITLNYKTEYTAGPGSYNINGTFASPNRPRTQASNKDKVTKDKSTKSEKAKDPKDATPLPSPKNTFQNYKRQEKMQDPDLERERLMTQSPGLKYDPKQDQAKQSNSVAFGFAKSKRENDIISVRQTKSPGPVQDIREVPIKKTFDPTNAVPISKDKRFVNRTQIGPSHRRQSPRFELTEEHSQAVSFDKDSKMNRNLFWSEKERQMQCTTDPAKYEVTDRYKDFGAKYSTQIHFGKERKKLLESIDKNQPVGPGCQNNQQSENVKNGKFSKTKRQIDFRIK